MRLTRPASLLLSSFLISIPVAAQQPQRDPQAVAILQQAFAASGGAALPTSSGFIASGTIQPTSDSPVLPGTFVWTHQGGEFRVDLQFGGISKVLVSGHGQPAITRGTVTQLLPSYITFANGPFHVPAAALAQYLKDTSYSVVLVGAVNVGTTRATQIHVSKDGDPVSALTSPQDWYISSFSGLPVRVEYRAPDAIHPDAYVVEAFDFPSFNLVNGVAVPPNISYSSGGRPLATIVISSIRFGVGISSSTFNVSSGVQQ